MRVDLITLRIPTTPKRPPCPASFPDAASDPVGSRNAGPPKHPNRFLGRKRQPAPASYLFENWKLLLAFRLPYFFRSTTRESRVRNPAAFRAGR